MPADGATSSDIALYQLKQADFGKQLQNANKIKLFLLKTIYDTVGVWHHGSDATI